MERIGKPGKRHRLHHLPGDSTAAGASPDTDWRLPNEVELLTLQSYGNASPSVPAAFNTGCTGGCTVLTCSCTSAAAGYWSSTSRQLDGAYAWVVGFSEGHVTYGFKTAASSVVRAMRVP